MLFKAEEYEAALTRSIDPNDYQEPRHFAEDYQVVEMVKKSLNVPGSNQIQRKDRALIKFLGAEARNAETNQRLWTEELPHWFGEFSYRVLDLLGDLSPGTLNEIAELSGFGPGANVGVASEGLVKSIKFDSKPACTKAAQEVLAGLMPPSVRDYWGENLLEKTRVVRGNGHFTVPKNWWIERCAAKEPLWNSYLQSGIGLHMRKRLRRFGINLQTQEWNQFLASMAEDWRLATIDLSSASDLLAKLLVFLALCYNGDRDGKRWYALLNVARSSEMKMPDGGGWRVLEMFASMGNGFTFPLETIVFYALIQTVVPQEEWCLCTAYGDDLIVPQAYAHCLVERLEAVGFLVNDKKTCLAGAFFESCGTDWFQSQNVRPFYLHKDPDNPAPYALQAANALRAWCLRVYGELPLKYARLWRWLKGQVPQAWRNPVPKELGDVGLHVGVSEAQKMGVRTTEDIGPGQDFHQWEGYIVYPVKVEAVYQDRRSFGVMRVSLLQLRMPPEETRQLGGLEAIRGLYGRIRTNKSVVLWKDDFSWASPHPGS